MKTLFTWALRFMALLLAFFLAIGGFTIAKSKGWLSPFGVESQTNDSQVVRAIERTQEVSLLRLSMQGIKEKSESQKLLGKSIPGTGETVFLQYEFRAKLGLDGSQVKVRKTGANAYLVSVPEFKFIGYAEPTFKIAARDGGVLSWVTPGVDETQMINEILSAGAQQQYVSTHEDLLREQTKVFYDSLITSIDPAVVTTYEFSS